MTATPACDPGSIRTAEEAPRRAVLGAWYDVLNATLVLVIGFWLGTTYVMRWSDPGTFYQDTFGAAVMSACGRGFVQPASSPALDAFLALKRQDLRCDEIPPSLPSAPATYLQREERYLMAAAAAVWRVRGVSWAGLTPLFGLLFALTQLVCYALFRLGMDRRLSMLGLVMLTVSSCQLTMLPFLRDYSKAPFLLGGALAAFLVASRPMAPRTTILVAVLAGLTAGIGSGFRIDVLIVVPLFLAAVLGFLPGSLRTTWRTRIAATVVFVTAFGATARPVLQALGNGGNAYHVVLLGFAKPFDRAIGVSTPVYQWLQAYNDTHVYAQVNSYAVAALGRRDLVSFATKEYDRAALLYLFDIARHFPADMIVRAYGVVLRTLDLFVTGAPNQMYLDPNNQKLVFRNPAVAAVAREYYRVLVPYVSGAGFLAFMVTLLLAAGRSIKLATFVLLATVYFCSYGLLQFSLRNTFHLEVFGLWFVLFIVGQLSEALSRLPQVLDRVRRGQVDRLQIGSTAVRVTSFAVVSAVVFGGVLQAARLYQERHVRRLVQEMATAPLDELSYSVRPAESGRLLLATEGFPRPVDPAEREPRLFTAEYLVIDLKEDHGQMPLVFRYRPTNLPQEYYWDHTNTVMVTEPPTTRAVDRLRTTRYILPIYQGPNVRFEGIELPGQYLSSVAGVWRMKDSRVYPYLWLTLRPGWERGPFYQTLADDKVAFPSDVDARDVEGDTPFATLSSADVVSKNNTVSARGSQFDVDTPVVRGSPTLFEFRSTKVRSGDRFVAKGRLRWGCFELVLTSEGQYLPVHVWTPGRFTAVIGIPADGNYSAVVAGSQCVGFNDFTIDSIGWIRPR